MSGNTSGKDGVADASLNVVPFIDLLACTICFLLVSAVWTHMSKIDVQQVLPKKAPVADNAPPPPPQPKINVAITKSGYRINLWNADKLTTPRPELALTRLVPTTGTYQTCRGKGGLANCQGKLETWQRYDRQRLRAALIEFLQAAGQGDKTRVMVAAADDVPYVHLIGTLDAVLQTCDPKQPTTCLKAPLIGDINLLKAEGFSELN
jgi:biopolymer transport protein ExbD